MEVPSELLWGSRKVTEAAAFHQCGADGAPRAENHAKMSVVFYLKCCCPTAPLKFGGPAPLAGWHSEHADSLLHGWLGFRGDDPLWTRCSLLAPGAEDVA